MKADGVKAATDPMVKAEMAANFMLLLSFVYKLWSSVFWFVWPFFRGSSYVFSCRLKLVVMQSKVPGTCETA